MMRDALPAEHFSLPKIQALLNRVDYLRMRSALIALVLGFLIGAHSAHALSSTDAHRTSSSKEHGVEKRSDRLLKVKSLNLADEALSSAALGLPNSPSPQKQTPASDASLSKIKALANGDNLVNPWVPGRGAIGVRVKVTW